jgi:glutamate-1-semialdehyde 2,1-aminomutase
MLTPDDLADLSARVATFANELSSAIGSSGLFAATPVAGPLMGLYLSRTPFSAPTNFAEAKVLCENGLYGPFFHAMLSRGVALAPGAYEILFVSLAHSEDDLARTVELAAESAKVVARS